MNSYEYQLTVPLCYCCGSEACCSFTRSGCITCLCFLKKYHIVTFNQGRRLGVASGVTAPGPALEGAPRFRPMSLSTYILR